MGTPSNPVGNLVEGEVKITNTVYFDFSETPIPTEYDFWKWLQSLGCGEDDFDVIDFKEPAPETAFKPMAVTRFRTEVAYQNFMLKFDTENPKIIINSTTYSIPIKIVCRAFKKIRVFNVPFEVDQDRILKVLESYGKVVEAQREKPKTNLEKFFKNVNYEKLAITMDLNKDIPDYITVDKVKYKVKYPGQPRVCTYCKKEGHAVKQCDKVKSRNTSWAQKVKNGKAKDKNQQLESNDPFPTLANTVNKYRRPKAAQAAGGNPPLSNSNRFAMLFDDNTRKRDFESDEEDETHLSDGYLSSKSKSRSKKQRTRAADKIRDNQKTVGSNLSPITPTRTIPRTQDGIIVSAEKSRDQVSNTSNSSAGSGNLAIVLTDDDCDRDASQGQNQRQEAPKTNNHGRKHLQNKDGMVMNIVRRLSTSGGQGPPT